MKQKIVFSGVVLSTLAIFITYFLLEKENKKIEDKQVSLSQEKSKKDNPKITQNAETNKQKPAKKIYISQKKKKFFSLILDPVSKIHKELDDKFLLIKMSLKSGKNKDEIKRLKRVYRVSSDRELLLAMKPHPQSIVIAQAALESAWGTSRIFKEANNIFGMWSKDENEPRIPALVKRDDNRTIWLRKFDNLEQSIRSYYFLMATGTKFKRFREVRYNTEDVTKILPTLDKYAEIGAKYPKRILKTIEHNNLTQYDKEK